MGFLDDIKGKIGMGDAKSTQEGGRRRTRRRGRKCRGGDETSDPTASMQGGRRRRGRKSRKSRRGTRKHTRRHRR